MKSKSSYFLLLLLVSAVLFSCSDPIEEELATVEVRAVQKLITPADKSEFDLSDNLPLTKFEWQAATVTNGAKPKYEILFYKENGTPSEPIHIINSNSTVTNVHKNSLNLIAEKAGIEPGEKGTIKWTVSAHYESISALSKEVGRIILIRPKEAVPITRLFLTGTGTEFGETVSEAMEFTKISDNVYYIVSELKAGLPFSFISNNEGDDIRTFSVKNNSLVEDGTESEIAKSGIYKIEVNYLVGSVKMSEITDISLYYSIKHRAINLQYEGRGIWKTVSLINFSQEAWGDETRYKFKMTEGNTEKFLEKVSEGSTKMKESVIYNHDSQLWDGNWGYPSHLKNKWAEVTVDMSDYTHSIEPVVEDFSIVGESWGEIADRSTSDFVKGFWNTGTKHFNNSLDGVVNRYDYWPEAHAIDVIIDAYERTGDNRYKQIIYDFYEGVKRKNGNTFKNWFYDDMAWHGLAHLRAYEATGDSRYEASAGDLWGWILEGWDDNGGIKWNGEAGSVPGVPSTGPATIIGVRRWIKYGDTEINDGLDNLVWAKRMYEWMRSERHDPATGGVYDDFANKKGAWTYNTGTFLGSAMELYDLTGEYRYLEDAIRTADWTLNNLSVPTENNYILSDWAEQEDHDVNLFKGIFIRYFTRLIMNPDLPAEKRKAYIDFIEYNANAMLSYASTTTDNDILIYNYAWFFKPKNSFLRGQISGCMLIEAMALLEKEGFL